MERLVQLQPNTDRYFEKNIVPADFRCGSSHRLMIDPVSLKCSHTFERTILSNHVDQNQHTCPSCRSMINAEDLKVNIPLKKSIEDFKEKTLTHISEVERSRDDIQLQFTSREVDSNHSLQKKNNIESSIEVIREKIFFENREKTIEKISVDNLKNPQFQDVKVLRSEIAQKGEIKNDREKEASILKQKKDLHKRQVVELKKINSPLRSGNNILSQRVNQSEEQKQEKSLKVISKNIEVLIPRITSSESQKIVHDREIAEAQSNSWKNVMVSGVIGNACLGVVLAEAAPLVVAGAVGVAIVNAARGIRREEELRAEEREAKENKQSRELSIERNRAAVNELRSRLERI